MESKGSVIVPGLVLLKAFLNVEEQCEAAKWAMLQGEKEWYNDSGELNCGATRGRIYKAWSAFSKGEFIAGVCERGVEQARLEDETMPAHDLTHLLLLRYLPSGGPENDAMIWHRDDGANDGDNDHPVVSLSVGCTASFGFKLPGLKPRKVDLESGDLLLFGGPSRLIMHCVHSVVSGTSPEDVAKVVGDARINFTFRDAPSVRGNESAYETQTLLRTK